jgi:hypothetical protein
MADILIAISLLSLSGYLAVGSNDNYWTSIDTLSLVGQGYGPMEGYSGLNKQILTAGGFLQKNQNAYIVVNGVKNLDTLASSNLIWTKNGVEHKEGFVFDKNWNFENDIGIAILQDYNLKVDPIDTNSPKASYTLLVSFPQLNSGLTSEQADAIKKGLITEPGNPNTLKFDPDSIDTFFGQLYDMYVYGSSITDALTPSGMSIDMPHSMSADGVSCVWGQKTDLEFGVQVPKVQTL